MYSLRCTCMYHITYGKPGTHLWKARIPPAHTLTYTCTIVVGPDAAGAGPSTANVGETLMP